MNTSRTPEECVRTVVHSYESLREQGHDDAEALTLVAHQCGLTKDAARWATTSAFDELMRAEHDARRTRWGRELGRELAAGLGTADVGLVGTAA